jgi:hypothetical protein
VSDNFRVQRFGKGDVRRWLCVVAATVVAASGCGSSNSHSTITLSGSKTTATSARTRDRPASATRVAVHRRTQRTSRAIRRTGCAGIMTINAHTSCPFAQAVRRDYLAQPDNTIGQRSPVTGLMYSLSCHARSGHVTCVTGTARFSFAGPPPTTVPETTVPQTTTPIVTQPPGTIPVPNPAVCQALYNEWVAGGGGSDTNPAPGSVAQQAIVEYGQIGCGQSPRTDGNTWCKEFQVDGTYQRICDFPPHTPDAYPPNWTGPETVSPSPPEGLARGMHCPPGSTVDTSLYNTCDTPQGIVQAVS